MTTTLEIESSGHRRQLTITHPICRIGSHPGLELCVPGIDSHAATLRLMGNKRLIYNRSPRVLRIGNKQLATDKTLEWPAGDALELGNGIVLRWISQRPGDGANQLRNAPPPPDAASTGQRHPSSHAFSRRSLLLGFLAVFGTILFLFDTEDSETVRDQQAAELVSQLRAAADQDGDGACREICFQLENAVLRRELRNQARFALVNQLSRASIDTELRERILDFVHTHLQ